MKLKIPPVALVLLVAALMWGVEYISDSSLAFEGQRWITKGLFALCTVVGLFAMVAFRKLKTTVDPLNPDKATSLVTIGIYHMTRNPMYLAMLLLLIGWAVKLGNPINLLPLIFFVWYMNQFQIKPEEEALANLFGEEYQVYCQKVRRWI